MSVQIKLTSVKTLTNASTTSVVELSNFNFSTITSAIKEFLRTVNYVQSDSSVSVDIHTIAANLINVKNGLSVYGTQLNTVPTVPVISLSTTGVVSAKNVVVENTTEMLRLRMNVFGALPPVGMPGEVIYIAAQGERREGVYVWLNSTGWTLLSGGSGGGTAQCMQEVVFTAPADAVTTDNTPISQNLFLIPSPMASTSFMVFINGQLMPVGDGTTNAPAYLSKDGGSTALRYNEADGECLLYWNPTIAGYGLDNTDSVTVHYFSIDPFCSQTGFSCDTQVVLQNEANSEFAYGVVLINESSNTGSFTVCRTPNPGSNIGGENLPEGYYLINSVYSYSLTDWAGAFPSGSIIKFTLPSTITQEDFSLVRIFNQSGVDFIDVTIDSGPYAPDYANRNIYADALTFGAFFLIKGDFTPTTTTTSSTTTTTTFNGTSTTTTTTCAPNQISYATDGNYYPTQVTFYGAPTGPFEVEFNRNGTLYNLTGMLGYQINLGWTFNVSAPTFSSIQNVVGVYTFTLPSGCSYTVTVPTGTTTTSTTSTTTTSSTTTTTTLAPGSTTTTTSTTSTTSTTTTTTLPPRVPRTTTTTSTTSSTTSTTTTP